MSDRDTACANRFGKTKMRRNGRHCRIAYFNVVRFAACRNRPAFTNCPCGPADRYGGTTQVTAGSFTTLITVTLNHVDDNNIQHKNYIRRGTCILTRRTDTRQFAPVRMAGGQTRNRQGRQADDRIEHQRVGRRRRLVKQFKNIPRRGRNSVPGECNGGWGRFGRLKAGGWCAGYWYGTAVLPNKEKRQQNDQRKEVAAKRQFFIGVSHSAN